MCILAFVLVCPETWGPLRQYILKHWVLFLLSFHITVRWLSHKSCLRNATVNEISRWCSQYDKTQIKGWKKEINILACYTVELVGTNVLWQQSHFHPEVNRKGRQAKLCQPFRQHGKHVFLFTVKAHYELSSFAMNFFTNKIVLLPNSAEIYLFCSFFRGKFSPRGEFWLACVINSNLQFCLVVV